MKKGFLKQGSLDQVLLYLFAFALPVSLGVAELFLFLAILFAVCGVFRGRECFYLDTKMAVPVILFAIVVLISVFTSTRPELSFGKLHRLLFLFLIFMVPGCLNDAHASLVRNLLLFFILGASCNVIYDLLRIYRHCAAGGELFDAGSMTTPQFYMVSVCVLAMVGTRLFPFLKKKVVFVFLAALSWNLLGLLLHFKRGVWLSTALAIGLVFMLRRKIWVVLLLLLCACSLLLLPQVRARVATLPEEFSSAQGGRWVLWSEVAPALVRQHPWGMGWQAMVHQDLVAHADYVQPGLDHLHNNVLQIAVELGIPGAIVWCGWMLSTLVYMFSGVRRNATLSDKPLMQGLVFGVAAAFTGLLLNGMLENNYDDSEIMLVYCMLIGAAIALRRVLSRTGN